MFGRLEDSAVDAGRISAQQVGDAALQLLVAGFETGR